MDLHEVGWGSMAWTDLAQDRGRCVNAVVNLRVPQNAGNFLTNWESLRFSRRTVLQGVSKDHLVITVTALSRAVKPSSCPHWLGPEMSRPTTATSGRGVAGYFSFWNLSVLYCKQ
jgi:hypothetical protein